MVSSLTMYIEIADDIIADAIRKGGSGVNDSLDLLTLFALNAQKGKHIVHVPWLHNNPTGKRALEGIMGRQHVAFLLRAEGIYYQLARLKQIVSVYAIITYDQSKGNPQAILINPLQEKKFEPYNETRVITENIIDSTFLKYVIKFFLRECAIRNCKFCFVPLMGGGDTTADVVKHEVEERQFFCLAISDSDRKCPYARYGQTATKIQDVINSYHPFNCDLYVMDQVMEIENLIPIEIVKKYASNKGYQKVFSLDSSFYDMKYGLTLNWLYDDDVCDYWRNMLYGLHVSFTQRDTAKRNSTCRKDYKRYVEMHNYSSQIKEGFGADLLTRCTCDFDAKGHRLDPRIKERMMNVKPSDLTTFQYNEWMKIGRILFSWTCCMENKRV